MSEVRLDLNVIPEATCQGQADFLDDRSSYHPAFVGGFGSGKTYAGCGKALTLSLLNRGLMGLMVAPTYRMIADLFWPTLFDELLDPRGIPYTFLKGDRHIKFPWGSEIIFRTGEEPRRIVGFQCAWSYLDEAPLVPEYCWVQMNRRMRQPGTVLGQLYATFTCEIYAWTHELWGRQELLGEPLPEDYTAYHGSTRDNYHLVDGYVRRLQAGCDEDMADAVIEGHFTAQRKGRVYYTYDEQYHKTAKAEYDPMLPLELSFDFNVEPGNHVLICQQHGPHLYVVDEVHRPGLRLEDACTEILDRYASRQQAHVIVYGDATGRQQIQQRSHYHVIQEILQNGILGKAHGFLAGISQEVPRANPSVANSCAAVRAALCDANGMRWMFINPACKRLRADLNGVQYAASVAKAAGRAYSGDPLAIYKGDQKLTHASDCLRYWVQKVRPQRTVFERQTDYKLA